MPYVLPDQQVIETVGAKALLTQMVVLGQHLEGAEARLFVNNFTPSPSNVLADFTEPGVEWPTYAPVAVAGWGAQRTLADGRVAIEATNLMEFVGPVAGGGPTVYGYFIRSGHAGTPLLYSVRFATPVPMVDISKVLDLVVSFTLPNMQ